MNWNSWGDFWAMGGYGLYVWGSYGFCVAAFVIELVLVRRGHRFALERIRNVP
jgi:heme exporter protein D